MKPVTDFDELVIRVTNSLHHGPFAHVPQTALLAMVKTALEEAGAQYLMGELHRARSRGAQGREQRANEISREFLK